MDDLGLPLIGAAVVVLLWYQRENIRRIFFPHVTTAQLQAWGQANWANILVPPLVVALGLWLFAWALTPWWEKYVAWGGPVTLLVFAALALAVIATLPTTPGKKRGAVVTVVIILGAAVGWKLFIRAPFFDPPVVADTESCDSDCVHRRDTQRLREDYERQLKRVEQQRQVELAAVTRGAHGVNPACLWVDREVDLGTTHVPIDLGSPNRPRCKFELAFLTPGACYKVWIVGDTSELNREFCYDPAMPATLPDGVKSLRSTGGTVRVSITLVPSDGQSGGTFANFTGVGAGVDLRLGVLTPR